MFRMFVFTCYVQVNQVGQSVNCGSCENGQRRRCLGRLCMYFLHWRWRSAREQFPMERTNLVGVGTASVEKVSSQMVNEVKDRCDVQLFLLESDSTPGLQDYVNEKFRIHYQETNPRASGLQRNPSSNCATSCHVFCLQWTVEE